MEQTHSSADMAQNPMLGVFYFSREIFIETMDTLKKQYQHDNECSRAFRVILPNDHISNYDNHLLTNQLVKLMQIALNDAHKHSWIEYYMWELDFGKKYNKGCATNKDGSNINLSNAGTLWDFLNNA